MSKESGPVAAGQKWHLQASVAILVHSLVYARIRWPKPLAGAEVVVGPKPLAGAENIGAGTRFRLYAFWGTGIRIIRG